MKKTCEPGTVLWTATLRKTANCYKAGDINVLSFDHLFYDLIVCFGRYLVKNPDAMASVSVCDFRKLVKAFSSSISYTNQLFGGVSIHLFPPPFFFF